MSDAFTPRARPSAEWLAEQEAKQAAYAARRRAWAETLRRVAEAPAEEEPPSVPDATATAQVPEPSTPWRRPRGPVHDVRQARLEF